MYVHIQHGHSFVNYFQHIFVENTLFWSSEIIII